MIKSEYLIIKPIYPVSEEDIIEKRYIFFEVEADNGKIIDTYDYITLENVRLDTIITPKGVFTRIYGDWICDGAVYYDKSRHKAFTRKG